MPSVDRLTLLAGLRRNVASQPVNTRSKAKSGIAGISINFGLYIVSWLDIHPRAGRAKLTADPPEAVVSLTMLVLGVLVPDSGSRLAKGWRHE